MTMNRTIIKTADKEPFLKDFEEYSMYEKRYSPYTIRWMKIMTKHLFDLYGYIEPGREYAIMVEQDLKTKGCKASTICKYYDLIEALHDYLSPDQKLKLSRPRITGHRIEYLTQDEVRKLIAACTTPRNRAIIIVLATTGLRAKELCQLDLIDVDLKKRILMVRDRGEGIKNNQEDSVVMSRECADILKEYLDARPWRTDTSALFLPENCVRSQPNKRLTQSGIWQIIKKIAKDAGMDRNIWPHIFRHTTGTLMAANGINLALVQRQLRHKNIRSTLVYITASEEILRNNIDEHFSYNLPQRTDPTLR